MSDDPDEQALALLESAAAHHARGERDPSLADRAGCSAPETLASGPEDLRTDVFLAGAALYAIATGQPAFGQPPDAARIGAGAVVSPQRIEPTLSRSVERALLAALSADPRHRPADIGELSRLWSGEQAPTTTDLAARARAIAARGTRGARFPSTRWSVVLQAGVGRREAMSALCEAYYGPLSAYARRFGLDDVSTEDAVQSFFADVIRRDDLNPVRPGRGRFRGWLMTAMRHHLLNEKRQQRASKRGGGVADVPLDAVAEPMDPDTPERAFQQAWAATVLERALQRLRDDYARRGQAATFAALQDATTGEIDRPYVEIAAELGVAVGALKVAVHRIRKRFAAAVRAEVADTVDDPSAIEAEIADLRIQL